jgi:hypothetical protein
MSSADSDSLRLSNTPTTTQALRCFSGLPLFMVNSMTILAQAPQCFLGLVGRRRDYSQRLAKKSKMRPVRELAKRLEAPFRRTAG